MVDVSIFIQRGLDQYKNKKQLGEGRCNATILIVGGNQGLGFECAKQVASKGAKTYITSRDMSKGEHALEEIKKENPQGSYGLILLDLQDDTSINNAVKQIKEKIGSLDVLVCNAGVIAKGELMDAFDTIMRTNVYGTFKLAEKALPYIKDGGRVVIVSSELAIHSCNPPDYVKDLDNAKCIRDPIFTKVPVYSSMKSSLTAYCVSKAIEAKYVELASQDPLYQNRKVQIVACNPGYNKSNLNDHSSVAPLIISQGAYSIMYCCLAPQNVNGQFLSFGHQTDVKENLQ